MPGDEGEEAAKLAAAANSKVGIPAGCVDWAVEGGKLVPSDKEENWRTSGNTVNQFGFELTQDLDNQQVDDHHCAELHCRSACMSSAAVDGRWW